MKRASVLGVLCVAAAAAGQAGAADQPYPTRPIRMIVGFPPAGAADIFARMIGQKMTESWGQTVVIDNRAGAGSTIGSEIAAAAVPDGHTLLSVSASYATSAGLYRSIKYDPVKSLRAVANIGAVPNVLLAHPSVPAKTVKDFIALAKAAPGKYTLGSAGTGSITHLAGELLNNMAGIKMNHIPYKGGGPNLIALLSGEIQITIASLPASLGNMKSGKVRALGVTSLKRSPAAPDVPAIAEAGVPGYEALNWYGVLAPAGVPRPIILKLNAKINEILQAPEMADALARQGAEGGGGTPEAFQKYVEAELAKWAGVIKTANVQLQ